MRKSYSQLILKERENIHFMLWDGLSVWEIARRLKRNPSTISREIKRNTPLQRRRYTPHLAQEGYENRKRVARERPRLKDPRIVEYVHEKMINSGWSPEQIAGRWNRRHRKLKISHEAIYQYIYASCKPGEQGDLRPYLRRKHKRRNRKKVPFKELKTTIPNRVSIDRRPKYIEKRVQLGHWEGDSIESNKRSKACLNVLNERVSKLVKVSRVPSKKTHHTAQAVIQKLHNYPEDLRRTLTLDNGLENADHQEITEIINTKCYFTHPYHSWERGTNENTNGLIRYYFPKGTDFAKVSEEEIKKVEDLLNNRPRKSLDYRTPLEVFNMKCCT